MTNKAFNFIENDDYEIMLFDEDFDDGMFQTNNVLRSSKKEPMRTKKRALNNRKKQLEMLKEHRRISREIDDFYDD
ncbi:hypothetical protein LP316_15270 [Thalassotalea sp. LPB0316]|uniref:hypothetical protein n=1 Tax=Thalassotalea sp. LPB0316 TaxID=2769490 RepID=UPI0018665749|nr:hypothetical protein [Thalassotalea sp. LPB0316]QOL25631.1 hypothetical protein LP316_15270 [Thalassotalea sp. LPB0316]